MHRNRYKYREKGGGPVLSAGSGSGSNADMGSASTGLGYTELVFASDRLYGDPVRDLDVTVELVDEDSGRRKAVPAFWDGGAIWKARIGGDAAGTWTYRVVTSDPGANLNGLTGKVKVAGYPPLHPLWIHGGLRAYPQDYRLTYADGTPFFWMADTAWNGVLKADPADWEHYLKVRHEQGFTAVQCVMTHWRAMTADACGETAFAGEENIRINPAFFARLDAKVAAINRHGLVAGLVILWACTPGDVGYFLPEDDAILLARYIVARYGCHQVVWFLGGDGNYTGDKAERWRRIGRKVFGLLPKSGPGTSQGPGQGPAPAPGPAPGPGPAMGPAMGPGLGLGLGERLVTMHPGGQQWVADEFRYEKWYSFVGYQSGHGDSAKALNWLIKGPPAGEWRNTPPRPIIDLEPNYEAHLSYHARRHITPHQVRRALYWNLLITPTAGVSYGNNSIWPWLTERGPAPGHQNIGISNAWQHGLYTPGIDSVTNIRRFFDSLPWWRLYPAPEMLLHQPAGDDPNGFVAAAKTDDNTLAVIYLPEGGKITLDISWLAQPDGEAVWYNPDAGIYMKPLPLAAAGGVCELSAPDRHDWVLLLRCRASEMCPSS